MTPEDKVREILFKIGQELKVHNLDGEHLIVEIDYEKYVKEIVNAISHN
jgi:hypothetical protein